MKGFCYAVLVRPYYLLRRLYSFAMGHQKVPYGRARFFGDRRFADDVVEALARLEEMDARLAAELASSRYCFFHLPKGQFQVGRTFTIGDDLLEWGPIGILTRVVLIMREKQLMGEPALLIPKTSESLRHIPAAYRFVVEWMAQHDLAPGLAEYYSKAASEVEERFS